MINYLSEGQKNAIGLAEDTAPLHMNLSQGVPEQPQQVPMQKNMSISARIEPQRNQKPFYKPNPQQVNQQYPQYNNMAAPQSSYGPPIHMPYAQYPPQQYPQQHPGQQFNQMAPKNETMKWKNQKSSRKTQQNLDIQSMYSRQSCAQESNKPPGSQHSQKRIQKNQQKHFSDLNQSSKLYLQYPSQTPILEHLDIILFKTQKCSIKVFHQHKTCPSYHHAKDRRRKLNSPYDNPALMEVNYTGDLCTNNKCVHLDEWQKGKEHEREEEERQMMSEMSEKGGRKGGCNKSRNLIEQLYHPDKYKKKFCSFYPDEMHKCEYKQFCSFAHSEQELRANLIHYYEMDADFFVFHYKTEWCPFNSSIHDKSKCVYAHNWQDYRRKVSEIRYSPNICQNWSNVDFITSYKEGCPQGRQCVNSHGWKESEYHPLFYKVRLCIQEMNCPRVYSCPFYHDTIDQRVLNGNILTATFLFYPRNRLSQIMQCLNDNNNRDSEVHSYKSRMTNPRADNGPPGLGPPATKITTVGNTKFSSCDVNMWNMEQLGGGWQQRMQDPKVTSQSRVFNQHPPAKPLDPWVSPQAQVDKPKSDQFDLNIIDASYSIADEEEEEDKPQEETDNKQQ